MNTVDSFPYISGETVREEIPLRRFLPDLPRGIASYWLKTNLTPNEWVIDPFGTSPFLPLEAVHAGNNILVVCNNPILQFYLTILAKAPKRNDFLAALADFAKEKHQNERFESHLKSLYETKCSNCGKSIQARAFIWKRNDKQPVSKLLSCEYCRTEGEFPVSEEDIHRLDQIGNDTLHRARALQRVNVNPKVLLGAEEVVQTYLARPLYFLSTIINRLERLQSDPFHKDLLYALVIYALDLGNSMWPWPTSRARPKQLSLPSQFRENNLWTAFENGIEAWCSQDKQIPLTIWPEFPIESPGICLYKGRVASLQSLMQKDGSSFSKAIAVFPRPNQAFWSLSAVWSGWLWGKNSVNPMKGALERKRFDWYWYSSAIHQTLLRTQGLLDDNGQLFGLIPDAEPGFITGAMIAAENAGFHLQGIALRSDCELMQGSWIIDTKRNKGFQLDINKECVTSSRKHQNLRNEPAEKLVLYTACLRDLVGYRSIPVTHGTLPYYTIKEIQQTISAILENQALFNRYRFQIEQIERDLFWLRNEKEVTEDPLSDRVELEISRILNESKKISLSLLDQAICDKFPGLFTPEKGMIKTITNNYAHEDEKHPDQFDVKEEALTENVVNQKQDIFNSLLQIGERLGFQVSNEDYLTWIDRNSHLPVAYFWVITSAAIGKILFRSIEKPNYLRAIIYPDFLENLLFYKLKANPRLNERLSSYGKIASFSTINILAQKEDLHFNDLLTALASNQLKFEEPSQISIFSSSI